MGGRLESYIKNICLYVGQEKKKEKENWLRVRRLGFPGGLDGKESAYNTGDPSSIPGLERSPGEGDLPTPVFLPEEFLPGSMHRGAWRAIVHEVAKNQHN